MQLIVTDLDRTLLHTDKSISVHSCRVLNSLRSNGFKLVFATARPPRSVRSFLEQIPCDAVICHNGALTLVDGIPFGQQYRVPIHFARKLLRHIQAAYPQQKLSVEINDRLYANFDARTFWKNTEFVQTDFTTLPDSDAEKVIVEIADETQYLEICSLLPPQLYGEISDGKLCLILNRNATKYNALRWLCAAWKIPREDVCGFGDDYNDIEMLRWCGIGVAMANAIPQVRSAADIVTLSNDEDGVAGFLERYLPEHGLYREPV